METNLDQFTSTEDDGYYTALKGNNLYEVPTRGLQHSSAPNIAMEPKREPLSSWSKPLLFITVLLCLILILLIIILGIVTVVYATGNNVECTNTATGASSSSNTNEWADRIAQNISQKITDFNEWANGVSQTTLQLFQNNTKFTEFDKQILQTTRDSAQKLINIVNTLSNLQDTSTSTARVVDDILLIAQELLVLHNNSTALLTTCKEIKKRRPLSPSGYYILVAFNGGAYETYCNMGTLCSSGGGWTRLAYLDMSDATQNCPSGFRLYQSGGVRACGRTNSGAGCVSVQFPSNGISYSQICGRVTGYQYQSPDATVSGNINSHYVDGVSITRGSPRQHVWTFINGWSDSYDYAHCNCNQQPQAFIGYNYFCESGNPNNTANQFFTSDPLWDGQNCGSFESTCCSATGIPWFHRNYGSTTTTDYIELRVCGNEGTSNEDSPVGFYEIYVK